MSVPERATGVKGQVPNLLTGFRIAVIPLLILAFYLDPPWSDWLPLILFVLASVTDFLDGALARAWNAGSKLGQFMDPIADKLLVVAVILMLAVTGDIAGIHVVPAIAILCREMFVSGLREFLAFRRVELPVTKLAKWKTAAQMAALTVLLLPFPEAGMPGLILFWIAAALALQTGWAYFATAMPHLREDGQ
ncbi:MAG: CDP-diacylglycerol--glycerol-3-phosphate 3-phosphatidyltransferase [Minwuia sp.]|uniref:CDP-diacylglycerol--glycerol-3-phosphate 3-phosphatidyltransferase n=1 Tax=Minwuia sp. TaxID=2493630 RepID=UPI003A8B8A04